MSLADEIIFDMDEIDDLVAIKEEEDKDIEEIDDMEIQGGDALRKYAKLRDSDRLLKIQQEIQKVESLNNGEGISIGKEEYDVIIEANNVVFEIENEMDIILKYLREIYNKRFPELEQLVPSAVEYMKTVQILGNDVQKVVNSDLFRDFLTSPTIMIISVSASATQGVFLDTETLSKIYDACKMGLELDSIQEQISRFVESRMKFVAPNMSNIVGSLIAAKLMGVAGGLDKLCNIPTCNLSLLGSKKKSLGGFSTKSIIPHMGYLYSCDLVQNQPMDYRMKACRIISSKLGLAARYDNSQESDGSFGLGLLKSVNYRLGKLQEPPAVKAVKPMAAPIDVRRKKRGGRRARKIKERLGITELRRQTKRVAFGEIGIDAYVEDIYNTPSVSGTTSGRIRVAAVDSNTNNRLSKSIQQKLSKQNQQMWGASTSVKRQIAGTASSFAFTPMQGIEIVNPDAAEKQQKDNFKYFGAASTFTSIKRT